MTSHKTHKTLNIIVFIVLIVSVGINIRGYFVIGEFQEGNIEIITESFKRNYKLKTLLENNEIEEARKTLDKRLEYEGILLGITALSDNSGILKEKIRD